MSDQHYMVSRTSAFATHWSDEPATFGPMSKEEAEKMVNSRWGGTMIPVSEWVKGKR